MDKVGRRCAANVAAVLAVGVDGLPDSPSAVGRPHRLGGAGTTLDRGLVDARAEVGGRG